MRQREVTLTCLFEPQSESTGWYQADVYHVLLWAGKQCVKGNNSYLFVFSLSQNLLVCIQLMNIMYYYEQGHGMRRREITLTCLF